MNNQPQLYRYNNCRDNNNKSKAEESFNEYSDSDYRVSDEEAHRNVVYKQPSGTSQLFTVMQGTWKWMSKQRMFMLSFILVEILVLLAVSGSLDSFTSEKAGVYGPGDYMATVLLLLPVFGVVIPASFMVKMIPSEFKDRTAYLNLALPMSKSTFYFGKFFAGMIFLILFFASIYAAATAVTIALYGNIDANTVLLSFGITIVGVFAISAMSYLISVFMKKGSSLLILILFFFVLPGIFCVVAALNPDSASDILNMSQYLPSGFAESALATLGTTPLLPTPVGMVSNFVNTYPDYDAVVDFVIYIAFGVVALFLGYFGFKRREA